MNDVILMSQTDCAQCLGTTPRTIRRWITLMNTTGTVNDAYGEPVRALAEE